MLVATTIAIVGENNIGAPKICDVFLSQPIIQIFTNIAITILDFRSYNFEIAMVISYYHFASVFVSVICLIFIIGPLLLFLYHSLCSYCSLAFKGKSKKKEKPIDIASEKER